MTKSTKKTVKKAKAVTTAKQEERNGIKRPRAGNLCAAVWDVLDKLKAKGEDTTASAALEALKGEKMADATVRTQTQRWREFNGVKRAEKKTSA